jgi:hypothetical protein
MPFRGSTNKMIDMDTQDTTRLPCKRCGGQMVRGHALQNTLSGSPDFPGGDQLVTLSRTGPAQVVPCLKCVRCGYSISTD